MEFVARILPWFQVIISILLVTLIVIQRASEGLGGAFGGDSGGGALHYTRRGVEKIIFRATIVCAVLFALSALLAIIL